MAAEIDEIETQLRQIVKKLEQNNEHYQRKQSVSNKTKISAIEELEKNVKVIDDMMKRTSSVARSRSSKKEANPSSVELMPRHNKMSKN